MFRASRDMGALGNHRGPAYTSRVMRIGKLPGWVVDDTASIKAEVAPYANVAPDVLWKYTEACARDAMWAARASSMPERVLSFHDPLPESSRVALSRLRRKA
jgi:hypothetical protein